MLKKISTIVLSIIIAVTTLNVFMVVHKENVQAATKKITKDSLQVKYTKDALIIDFEQIPNAKIYNFYVDIKKGYSDSILVKSFTIKDKDKKKYHKEIKLSTAVKKKIKKDGYKCVWRVELIAYSSDNYEGYLGKEYKRGIIYKNSKCTKNTVENFYDFFTNILKLDSNQYFDKNKSISNDVIWTCMRNEYGMYPTVEGDIGSVPYKISYKKFIKRVNKHFVSHKNLKKYLKQNGYYNSSTDMIEITNTGGGMGGPNHYEAINIKKVKKNVYVVTGRYLEIMEKEEITSDMKKNKDYIVETYKVDGKKQKRYWRIASKSKMKITYNEGNYKVVYHKKVK